MSPIDKYSLSMGLLALGFLTVVGTDNFPWFSISVFYVNLPEVPNTGLVPTFSWDYWYFDFVPGESTCAAFDV